MIHPTLDGRSQIGDAKQMDSQAFLISLTIVDVLGAPT